MNFGFGRGLVTLALVAVATTAGSSVGCGGVCPGCGPSSGDPTPSAVGPSGDGRIFVDWTLAGKAVSTTACAGVQKLALSLTYTTDQTVSIEPITCSLTRFRYDKLPTGYASLVIEGFDANGCARWRGNTNLQVQSALPDQPAPTVDLQPTGGCR